MKSDSVQISAGQAMILVQPFNSTDRSPSRDRWESSSRMDVDDEDGAGEGSDVESDIIAAYERMSEWSSSSHPSVKCADLKGKQRERLPDRSSKSKLRLLKGKGRATDVDVGGVDNESGRVDGTVHTSQKCNMMRRTSKPTHAHKEDQHAGNKEKRQFIDPEPSSDNMEVDTTPNEVSDNDNMAGGTSSNSDSDHDADSESDDNPSNLRARQQMRYSPRRRTSTASDGSNQSKSTVESASILDRISNQLQQLTENHEDILQAVDKLEEKVELLEQQTIAARTASVEKQNPSRRTRRSGARVGRFVIPKPRTRRGDDRNEILVVLLSWIPCFIDAYTSRPQAAIRSFMNPKLGIRRDKDFITLDISQFPSAKDTKRLTNRNGGRLGDRLPVCWEDLHCLWNESLSKDFVSSFIELHPQYDDQKEEVIDHFWQRLDRLKSLRQRTSRREGETQAQCNSRRHKMFSDEQRRLRKRSRQDQASLSFFSDTRGIIIFTFQLHLDRLRVASENANHHPDLDQRRQWASVMCIIQKLGVPGMSSDESEDTDGNMPERRYTIKARAWRSKDIQDLMARTDQELKQTKRSLYGNAPPGNPPRIRHRVKTPAQSQRAAVGQLPVNFYNRDWLRRLSDVARGQLSPARHFQLPKLSPLSRRS
ncbi:hypothetical protein PM082_022266 [Marasmius tenuissimus]|nr:hypothetical protein PM082_022266 [Marasmius tenuissimus]